MTKLNELKEIPKALVKLHSVLSNPQRTAQAHKYRYTPLEVILDIIRKPLHDVGLCIIQEPSNKNGIVGIETHVLHSSGETYSFYLETTLAQSTIQDMGSAITYLKRYSILGILGIQPTDEDDDGQSAMPKNKGQGRSTPLPPVDKKPPEPDVFRSGRFVGKKVTSIPKNDLVVWIHELKEKKFDFKNPKVKKIFDLVGEYLGDQGIFSYEEYNQPGPDYDGPSAETPGLEWNDKA